MRKISWRECFRHNRCLEMPSGNAKSCLCSLKTNKVLSLQTVLQEQAFY